MNPHRTLLLLALAASADRAGATEVTFRLLDQSGTMIAGSSFNPGNGPIRENRTIVLEPGTYTVKVRPGILGQLQHLFLSRNATVLVQGPQQLVELVWTTANLNLALVDQDGMGIPGTSWVVSGFDAVLEGSTTSVALPVTHDPDGTPIGGIFSLGYPVEIYPGLLGQPQQNLLGRVEPVRELSDGGDVRTYEWRTAALALRLYDGEGVLIAGSHFAVPGIPVTLGGLALRVTLPVTEDPTHPAPGSPYAAGYPITVMPGILGAPQSSLWRVEPPMPLTSEGRLRAMDWPLADLALSLTDQDGLPIEGSAFKVGGSTPLAGPSVVVVLPVTDFPSAPPASGPFAAGYPVEVWPGINGLPQTDRLQRTEPPLELEPGGGARALVWETTRGTLHVVGGDGEELAGASLRLADFVAEQPSGATVALPVNALGTDPPPAGPMAGGYPFELRSGDGVPIYGPFAFAVEPDERITPSFVLVDGANMGLRFNLCSGTLSLDGDSIPDCVDNCPGSANEQQADDDGDRVGDACDNCPRAYGPDQADADADGSGDACDNCPAGANPGQADADADQAGDACDNCPAAVNTGQTDLDSDGTGNACDLDDGLIFVSTPAPGRIEWDEESGFGVWNVYRGDLAILRAGGEHSQAPGSNDLAARFCGLVDAALDDPLIPEPDGAGFYLVTGVGTTESGLGDDSAGTPRPHANPCP